MKVNAHVYTKDIEAALNAFKQALENGATDISLHSSEDYETKKFQYLSLMFETDHSDAILDDLDKGPFKHDYDALG